MRVPSRIVCTLSVVVMVFGCQAQQDTNTDSIPSESPSTEIEGDTDATIPDDPADDSTTVDTDSSSTDDDDSGDTQDTTDDSETDDTSDDTSGGADDSVDDVPAEPMAELPEFAEWNVPDCAADELPVIGQDSCELIGKVCPQGLWPMDIPEGDVRYVQVDGNGDGTSTDNAMGSIQQAVNQLDEGGTVVLSMGVFTEAVSMRSGVTLMGACVGGTVLQGPAGSEALQTDFVRCPEGSECMFTMLGGGLPLVCSDPIEPGVAPDLGISVPPNGSCGYLEHLIFSNLLYDDLAGMELACGRMCGEVKRFGVSTLTIDNAQDVVISNLELKGPGKAVVVSGDVGQVAIRSVKIQDPAFMGIEVSVNDDATVELERVRISGLQAVDFDSFEAANNVDDEISFRESGYNSGIMHWDGAVRADTVAIDSYYGFGVTLGDEGASFFTDGLVVTNALGDAPVTWEAMPGNNVQAPAGLAASSGEAVLEGAYFAGTGRYGVTASVSSRVDLSDIVVQDTDETGLLLFRSEARLNRVLIRDAVGSGIIGAGPTFDLQAWDVTVNGIGSHPAAQCSQNNAGGYGFVALGGTTVIDGFHMEQNETAGFMLVDTINNWILPDFAQAQPNLNAANGELFANGIGLNIQAAVNLDEDFSGVLAYNNENIDISYETLPLPSVGAAGGEVVVADPTSSIEDFVASLGPCPEHYECLPPPFGGSELGYCLPVWYEDIQDVRVEPPACDSCGTCTDGSICVQGGAHSQVDQCLRKCTLTPESNCTSGQSIGDGTCEAWNNTHLCSYDGGDCCESTCEGSGCSSNQSGMCADPNATELFGDPELCVHEDIGNGHCDPVNNASSCMWDGGDCCADSCRSVNGDSCNPYDSNLSCRDPKYRFSEGLSTAVGCWDNELQWSGLCENDSQCGTGECLRVYDNMMRQTVSVCIDSCTEAQLGEPCSWGRVCLRLPVMPVTSGGVTANQCVDGVAGDGTCDRMNNTSYCGWDGGDCCESTCTDAAYSCGLTGYECLNPGAVDYEDPNQGGTIWDDSGDDDFGGGDPGGGPCITDYISDGYCDDSNNKAACQYDGGDCCPSTCISTPNYSCGTAGFNCQDPSAEDYGTVNSGGGGTEADPSPEPGLMTCMPGFSCMELTGNPPYNGICSPDEPLTSSDLFYFPCQDNSDCMGMTCLDTGSLSTCVPYCEYGADDSDGGGWGPPDDGGDWGPPDDDGDGDGGWSDCVSDYNSDGWCDSMNNNAECGYDGGDCCESTCVNAAYICGDQAPFDCQDPEAP